MFHNIITKAAIQDMKSYLILYSGLNATNQKISRIWQI